MVMKITTKAVTNDYQIITAAEYIYNSTGFFYFFKSVPNLRGRV